MKPDSAPAITIWGAQAEVIAKHAGKGGLLQIEARFANAFVAGEGREPTLGPRS